MRLWIFAMSGLGSVVMMVQESTCEPSGLFQISHKPAKAKGSPDSRRMYMGVLALAAGSCFHS